MIAVDSSALLAVVLNEALGDACDNALQAADHCILSAAILTEVMLVAGRHNVRAELQTLLDALGAEIVPVDEIVLMNGYDKLTWNEQKQLLSFEDNLVLMEAGANSSKGGKRWANWDEGRVIYGDDVWKAMVTRESEVRTKLRNVRN